MLVNIVAELLERMFQCTKCQISGANNLINLVTTFVVVIKIPTLTPRHVKRGPSLQYVEFWV